MGNLNKSIVSMPIEDGYEQAIREDDPLFGIQLLKMAEAQKHPQYIDYAKNLYKKFPECLDFNWHIVKILRSIGKVQESLFVLRKINKPNEYLWWSNALKNYLILNEIDLAKKCGNKIFELLLKTNNIIIPKKQIKTQFTSEFKKNKENYISFSLFGKKKFYGYGLLKNIEEYNKLLPQWKIVVYCDEHYDSEILNEINSNSIVKIMKPKGIYDGLFWRYQAFLIPDAFRVLIRDADSTPTEREIISIKKWISSGYKYHVIRDHIEHAELILAGMFGGIAGYLSLGEEVSFLNFQENRWIDQEYLRKSIYKKIMHSIYVNDEFYNIEPTSEKIEDNSTWIESDHIGSRQFR
jgi:hypothetical protein